MSLLVEVTEGWTERISFTLKADGAAIDGTGLTVSDLAVTGRDGTRVTTTAKFGWITRASGTVYFDPAEGDLLASKSPYRVKYKVVDGASKVVYFPSGEADTIVVHPTR